MELYGEDSNRCCSIAYFGRSRNLKLLEIPSRLQAEQQEKVLACLRGDDGQDKNAGL